MLSLYNSAVFSAVHRNPTALKYVSGTQSSPPVIRVSPLGSTTEVADSRAVFSGLVVSDKAPSVPEAGL